MKESPLIPMGSITGKPDRAELRKMMEEYLKHGITQFLIYPRSGLEYEYMSPEWLECCRHIIEFADENNMKIWLYDEYNWPSGKCKGKVVRTNPDFASKKLVAFADRNFMGDESEEACKDYYWTVSSIPLYADLLNPAAVDCFIETTHEVYYKEFGKYFGSVIKGIFSDEPSLMYALFQPIHGSCMEIPYYDGLKSDYQKATGRNLISDLEKYLAKEDAGTLWTEYWNLMGKRFCESYMDKIRVWCKKHNILSTGHLMSESHVPSAIKASGSPVDAIRAFSMPGLDEIFSHTDFDKIEWETFKLLESAMNGSRTEALAELFALGPSDMSMNTMRFQIYLAALHGVNHYVTAVSALDARANIEKPFYYNPVSPIQPWFRHIGLLNESAGEAAALTRKQSSSAIALRYPQKLFCSQWNHKENFSLKIDFPTIIKALINAQHEFRIIGDDENAQGKYKAVLELCHNGITDEISQKEFSDLSGMLSYLDKAIPRRIHVEKDGRTIEKLLIKSFDDGTACILNCSGKDLHGLRIGNEIFDLLSLEPLIYPLKKRKSAAILELNEKSFTYELESPNSFRCIFTENKDWEFEVESEFKASFAIRQYGGAPALSLDGQSLKSTGSCQSMPEGFSQLYTETEELAITKGLHKLSLLNSAKDYPYLPLCLLRGSFSNGGNKKLKKCKTQGKISEILKNDLKEYAGTTVFKGEIDTENYEFISVSHQNMPIEIIADGTSLGTMLWPPFCLSIPSTHKNRKVHFEIKISSSIAPMFSNYPAHEKRRVPEWLNSFWPKQLP